MLNTYDNFIKSKIIRYVNKSISILKAIGLYLYMFIHILTENSVSKPWRP